MKRTLEMVCKHYNVTREQLFLKVRTLEVVKPRAILYALLRRQYLSYPTIGRFMHRDHTTIIWGSHMAERHWPEELAKLSGVPIPTPSNIIEERKENAARLGIELNDYLAHKV